jgi:hypothetical protein
MIKYFILLMLVLPQLCCNNSSSSKDSEIKTSTDSAKNSGVAQPGATQKNPGNNNPTNIQDLGDSSSEMTPAKTQPGDKPPDTRDNPGKTNPTNIQNLSDTSTEAPLKTQSNNKRSQNYSIPPKPVQKTLSTKTVRKN